MVCNTDIVNEDVCASSRYHGEWGNKCLRASLSVGCNYFFLVLIDTSFWSSDIMNNDLSARKMYEGKGQVITSHSICDT